MKLKKVILSISVLSLGLIMLAGCSSNSGNSKPKETKKVEKKNTTKKKPKAKKKEVTTDNTTTEQDSSNDSKTVKPTQLDPKVIAVLTELKQEPDVFKENYDKGTLYFLKTNWPSGIVEYSINSQSNTDDSNTSTDDPDSTLNCHICLKGSTDDNLAAVNYYGNRPDAGPMLVKDLISDYYSNQDQQNEVNSYVSKIITDPEVNAKN